MGSLLDSDLRRHRSHWEPGNVGVSDRLRGQCSATLLKKGPGGWGYGDEIPIQVTLNELEFIALPAGDDMLYWSGIEVRVEKQKLPEPNARYYVTAALLPPSYLWYAEAPLLPGIHAQDPDFREALGDLATGKIPISGLPFDPFETNPEYVVARLGDLIRPHWDQEKSTNVGDGFLVVRNPNRKSSGKRMWMFGLCPEAPNDVVTEIVQQMQPDVEALLAGSAPFYRPPRKSTNAQEAGDNARLRLDWGERRNMGAIHPYTPDMEMTQLSLSIAVRQSLARNEGSPARLEQRIQTRLMNHYRDLDRRRSGLAQPTRKVRAGLEEQYRKFIGEHPECDRLRPNGRLDTKLLDRSADLPDTQIRLCRDRFISYYLKAAETT